MKKFSKLTLYEILILILTFTTVFFGTVSGLFIFDSLNKPKYQTDENIKTEVLSKIKDFYVQKFPSQKELQIGELKGLVGSLNDPYSEYLEKKENDNFQDNLNQRYEGIGVKFTDRDDKITVTQVFEDSPADKAGIKIDDVLVKIDNQELEKQKLAAVIDKIRGPEGSKIKLSFSRQGKIQDYELTREKIQSKLIYLTVRNDVGIIEISSFGENLDNRMQEIAKQILEKKEIKRVIIDLRDNTGGLLEGAIDVASYFLSKDELILYEKEKDKETVIKSKSKNISLSQFPLTILVNENTASASEILAGALRDKKSAKLVGRKTFGKGVVQRVFKLTNGDTLKLTIAEWLTPNRGQINKKGLEPDVTVPKGQDILEEALKLN